ncbi:Protein-disulfide isomerase [Frankia canadensis]|uniref:Protein-disulfide isomerase n=1 Tax=Frankia canadensis TaxID=1836972 RepID=A0A2I2KYH6_9ACTN|nr:thioredoxin domain-containing protein [Frankia canadensis]SNQ50723.1 Protein-disulfide isomerase [Frankia canadensis]SOU58013.1 Protein-disulfide isomerase [Frankia canadensis]
MTSKTRSGGRNGGPTRGSAGQARAGADQPDTDGSDVLRKPDASGSGGGSGSKGGSGSGGGRPVDKRRSSADERRAKAAAARAAEAARERRRRNWIVAGVVVLALLVAGGIGFAVQNSREESKPVVLPAGSTGTDHGIVVGKASAPVTVDMYEDFQCPACEALEKQTGSTFRGLLDEGKIKIDYHMMSFLGPESKRAANASAAAANEGKFRQLHDVLYANQPKEHTGGFTNATLIELGAKAGLTSQAYKDAVNNGTYDGYVAKVDSDAGKAGVTGTPTVLINGRQLTGDQLTPDGFRAAVSAAS